MRIVIILAVLFLIRNNVKAQNKYRDNLYYYKYDKEIIRKNKITKLFIESSFGNEHGSIGKDEITFNKNGELRSFLMISSKGDSVSLHTYHENKKGNVIISEGINYENHKKDTIKYLKYYNSKNKLIKDSTLSVSLLPTIYYDYDYKDRLIKETKLITFSEFTKRIKQFIYNNLNTYPTRVKEVFYKDNADTVGTIISDRTLKYTKEGKVESENEKIQNNPYMPQNKGTTFYFYDKYRRLVETKSTDGASYKYEYNDKGLLSSEEQHLIIDGDETVTITKFKYQFVR
jgi:YD repeat-containing protein